MGCPTPFCLHNLVTSLNEFEPNIQPNVWNDVKALEVGARTWSLWPTQIGGLENLFSFIPQSVTSLSILMPGEDSGWAGGDWDTPLALPTSRLQSLTNLELRFGRLYEIMAPPIFNTLKQCTNLESLTIDLLLAWLTVPEMDPTMVPLQEGVLLPKLRRLHLSQVNSGGLDALKLLKMPLLLDMYLSLEIDDVVDRLGEYGPPAFVTNHNSEFTDVDLLVDPIRGDGETESQLRSLHIKAASFANGALFRVLHDLRRLTHLTLEWVEFLWPSADDSDFSNLIPHLSHLKTLDVLNLKHAPDFEIPSLRRFVEGRDVRLTVTYMPDYLSALVRKEKEEEEDLQLRFGYDSDSDETYRNPMMYSDLGAYPSKHSPDARRGLNSAGKHPGGHAVTDSFPHFNLTSSSHPACPLSVPMPSPPHAQYLLSNNNDSPTHHEVLAVREEIEEGERQRHQLLQELAIIESQLAVNTARLESLRPIFAPIRRVPFEILGEIFLGIPTSQLRPGNHQKSVSKLLLVCKRWGDAARLTPRLWSNIWVNAENPKLPFEVISRWTSRAGTVPKEIEISSSCCGGVEWGNFRSIRCAGRRKCLFSRDIFPKLLKQTSGTWRSVSLNCPTPNCLRNFMESLQAAPKTKANNGWNFLQSFEVTASKWADWLSPSAISALSLIPQSVTEVTLHLPPVPRQEAAPLLVLAWIAPLHIPKGTMGGLTSLKVRFDAKAVMAPSALFNTLQHCTNLKALEVDLSGHPLLCHDADPRTAYFIEHGVPLPKLQHLRVRQISPKSLEALKLIKSPTLLELSISFYLDSRVDRDDTTPNFSKDEDDVGPMAAHDGRVLADFIRGDRSSPPTLQNLHLKNLFFFDGALHHILHDLDSLRHLQLEWVGIPGNADDFQQLHEGGPECLPQLKKVEVSKLKYPIGGEIPFLREFVEARNVDLELSVHDRVAWAKDEKRYFYLTGYESEDDDY